MQPGSYDPQYPTLTTTRVLGGVGQAPVIKQERLEPDGLLDSGQSLRTTVEW